MDKLSRIDGPFAPLVGDGAIGMVNIANGRLIPVLILDTSDCVEVARVIEAHRDMPPGDVATSWRIPLRSVSQHDALALRVQFFRPMEVGFTLPFKFPQHLRIVDLIVRAESMYLQSGKPGDVPSRTMDNPRVVLEVASAEEFRPKWEKMLRKILEKRVSKKGRSKKQIKQLVEEQALEIKGFGDIRAGRRPRK